MATKTVQVVTCDFPHKREKPAIGRVTIDVCGTHAAVLDGTNHPEEVAAYRTKRDKENARRRRSRANNPTPKKTVNGFTHIEQTCPDCGRTFKSQQALSMHRTLAAKKGSHEVLPNSHKAATV